MSPSKGKASKRKLNLRIDKRTFCYSSKSFGPDAGVVIGVLKWLIFSYRFLQKNLISIPTTTDLLQDPLIPFPYWVRKGVSSANSRSHLTLLSSEEIGSITQH